MQKPAAEFIGDLSPFELTLNVLDPMACALPLPYSEKASDKISQFFGRCYLISYFDTKLATDVPTSQTNPFGGPRLAPDDATVRAVPFFVTHHMNNQDSEHKFPAVYMICINPDESATEFSLSSDAAFRVIGGFKSPPVIELISGEIGKGANSLKSRFKWVLKTGHNRLEISTGVALLSLDSEDYIFRTGFFSLKADAKGKVLKLMGGKPLIHFLTHRNASDGDLEIVTVGFQKTLFDLKIDNNTESENLSAATVSPSGGLMQVRSANF